ncbi:alpha/beta fold hydrolase, partial [Nocardia vinacea]|uniref:alpha/beta fold hydrolase n=1 Tax=Nocardia vinacea TaxID=96468 RepID=UPI0012F6A221
MAPTEPPGRRESTSPALDSPWRKRRSAGAGAASQAPEHRKPDGTTPWTRSPQPATAATHPTPDQPLDAAASKTPATPQMPDTLAASYRELHDWAATRSDEDVQRLIAHTTAEVTAHLGAFRHGAPPPVDVAVAAARLLNVLIWEQCHRIQANTHQGTIPDYSTLFDLGRDLETRLPVVRALLAATNAVFDLAGALPLKASEDIPEPLGAPQNELNFLDTLPSHLGRIVHSMTTAVETMPWSEDWGFPRKTKPEGEHRAPTNAAISAINGLVEHFKVRGTDRTDWSEYIDGYLRTGLIGGFDADVARAIDALRSESDAFDPTRTESDRTFAAAAASFLPNIVTVVSYYLTRTREPAAAFELLEIASNAFVASAARLPDIQPLQDAAELIRHLRDAIAKHRKPQLDFQDPTMLRGRAFTLFVDHPRFSELLTQTVLALRRAAETPTTAAGTRPTQKASDPKDQAAAAHDTAEQTNDTAGQGEKSTRTLRKKFGNKIFRHALTEIGENRTALEIRDEVLEHAVEYVDLIGDPRLEALIISTTRRLVEEHRDFLSFRDRILAEFITEEDGAAQFQREITAMAQATKSELVRALRALAPPAQNKKRQLWPLKRGEGEVTVRQLVITVAAIRGAYWQLQTTPTSTARHGYALTDRELEVLELIAQRRGSHTIERLLGISKSTVWTHRSRIEGKLGISRLATVEPAAAEAAANRKDDVRPNPDPSVDNAAARLAAFLAPTTVESPPTEDPTVDDAAARLAAMLAPSADKPAAPATPLTPPDRGVLSEREGEVLDLLQAGMTHAQIAAALGVDERTVKNHQANAAAKLNTTGAVQTVMAARRQGLLTKLTPIQSHGIRLSPEELSILRLMAEGLSDIAIAARLGIATRTVVRRRARMAEEFGVRRRTPLLMKALHLGILDEALPHDGGKPTPQLDTSSPTSQSAPDGRSTGLDSVPPTHTGYRTVAPSEVPPEDATEIDLVWLTVNSDGQFLGPDNQQYRTDDDRGGQPFLLTTAGKFITTNASHDELLVAFLQQGGSLDELSGFGTFKLDGRPTEVEAFDQNFGDWNADPMVPAQILDALLQSEVDLSACAFDELGADRQGLMWRGQGAQMPVAQLVRDNGRDADKLFRGYGVRRRADGEDVVFWVGRTSTESAAGAVSIELPVELARGGSAAVTVTLTPHNDTFIARYSIVDLGPDRPRAIAAIGLLHEKLTTWLAESGISWAEDSSTAPVDDRREPTAPPADPTAPSPRPNRAKSTGATPQGRALPPGVETFDHAQNPVAPVRFRLVGTNRPQQLFRQGLGFQHDDNQGDPRFWDPLPQHRDENASSAHNPAAESRGDGPDGSSPRPSTGTELPPAVQRRLATAETHAAEMAAEALRPGQRLGIDTTSLHLRDAAEIEQLVLDLEELQRQRLAAALQQPVTSDELARIQADDAAVRELGQHFRALKPHVETAFEHLAETRIALAILAARDLLAAEGAVPVLDDEGRPVEGVGEVPGERIVVVSPLRGQEFLLDVLAPGLRERAEREGLPIEYRRVLIDKSGHLHNFRIRGDYDGPDPGIGFYTIPEETAWLNGLIDERPFAEKVAEAEASGELSRRRLDSGSNRPTSPQQIYLITYNNGYQAVEWTMRNERQADSQELGLGTARDVGVPAPDVLRRTELVLLVEYVPGRDADRLPAQFGTDAWESYLLTPDAKRLGLANGLIRPSNWHTGDKWRLDRAGRLVPVNYLNAYTDRADPIGFVERVVTEENGTKEWLPHDTPSEEIAADEQRLIDSLSRYARLGRTGWYVDVLEGFTGFQETAVETTASAGTRTTDLVAALAQQRSDRETRDAATESLPVDGDHTTHLNELREQARARRDQLAQQHNIAQRHNINPANLTPGSAALRRLHNGLADAEDMLTAPPAIAQDHSTDYRDLRNLLAAAERVNDLDAEIRLRARLDAAVQQGEARQAALRARIAELADRQGVDLDDPAAPQRELDELARRIAQHLGISQSAVGPWVLTFLEFQGATQDDTSHQMALRYNDLAALTGCFGELALLNENTTAFESLAARYNAATARREQLRADIGAAADIAAIVLFDPLDPDPAHESEGSQLHGIRAEVRHLGRQLHEVADQLLVPPAQARQILPSQLPAAGRARARMATVAAEQVSHILELLEQDDRNNGLVPDPGCAAAEAFHFLNREQRWDLVGRMKDLVDVAHVPARWRDRDTRTAIPEEKQTLAANLAGLAATGHAIPPESHLVNAILDAAVAGIAMAEDVAATLPGEPPVHALQFASSEFGQLTLAIGDVDAADEVHVIMGGQGVDLDSVTSGVARMAEGIRNSARTAPGRKVAYVLQIGHTDPNNAALSLISELVGLIDNRRYYATQDGGRPELTRIVLESSGSPADDMMALLAYNDPELAPYLVQAAPSLPQPSPDGSTTFDFPDDQTLSWHDPALAILLEGSRDCALWILSQLLLDGVPVQFPDGPQLPAGMWPRQLARYISAAWNSKEIRPDEERTARDKIDDLLGDLGPGAQIVVVVDRPGELGAHATLWRKDKKTGRTIEGDLVGYDPNRKRLERRDRTEKWTEYVRGTSGPAGEAVYAIAIGSDRRPVTPLDPNLPVPGAPGHDYPGKLIGSPPAEPDGPASPPDNEPVESNAGKEVGLNARPNEVVDASAQRARLVRLREQAREMRDAAAEMRDDLDPATLEVDPARPDRGAPQLEQLRQERDALLDELVRSGERAEDLDADRLETLSMGSDAENAAFAGDLLELNTLVDNADEVNRLDAEIRGLDAQAPVLHGRIVTDEDATDTATPEQPVDDQPFTYRPLLSDDEFNALPRERQHEVALAELSTTALVFRTREEAIAYARQYWNQNFSELERESLAWIKGSVSESPLGYVAANDYLITPEEQRSANDDAARHVQCVDETMHRHRSERDMFVTVPLVSEGTTGVSWNPGFSTAEMGHLPSNRFDFLDVGITLAPKGTRMLWVESVTGIPEAALGHGFTRVVTRTVIDGDQTFEYGYMLPQTGDAAGPRQLTGGPDAPNQAATTIDTSAQTSAQPRPALPTGKTTVDESPADMAFEHPGITPFAPDTHSENQPGVEAAQPTPAQPDGSEASDFFAVEPATQADRDLAAQALRKAAPDATAAWMTRVNDARRRSAQLEIQRWWHRLSDDEQAALVKVYPGEVCARDQYFPTNVQSEAAERSLKLLVQELRSLPAEELTDAQTRQLEYAVRLWNDLTQARARDLDIPFAVHLLRFDPTTLVSLVGLSLIVPGAEDDVFWHLRVGPDDTSWPDQLFEPGPGEDDMAVHPGRRTEHRPFEVTVGTPGVPGTHLAAAEVEHAAEVAADEVAEWLGMRDWHSDEQIETVRVAVAELAARALADSTGEVRVVARIPQSLHRAGERELIVEVIDNNPESSGVQEFTAARKADKAGVVQLEDRKSTWLAFEESLIHALLPSNVLGEELLGQRNIDILGGADPGFKCGRMALHRLGFSAIAAPGFSESFRPDYPMPLPWPDEVVGAITELPPYCPSNFAAAVVAHARDFRALGISAREHKPFLERAGMQPGFLNDEEWAWLQDVGGQDRTRDGVHLDRLFRVIKDAVSESLDALLPEVPHDSDIHVTIDLATGTFQAHLPVTDLTFFGPPVQLIEGKWRVRDGVVLAVATVPHAGDATPTAHIAADTQEPETDSAARSSDTAEIAHRTQQSEPINVVTNSDKGREIADAAAPTDEQPPETPTPETPVDTVELPTPADYELIGQALDKLVPGATIAWLKLRDDNVLAHTDHESWWEIDLSPQERATLIKVYPDVVLGMDMTHDLETLNAANRQRVKLLVHSLNSRPRAELSDFERQQLRYATSLLVELAAAQQRADVMTDSHQVPLVEFDPDTLVSRVGLEQLGPEGTLSFWHLRVGPYDASWSHLLFEPGPGDEAMAVHPGRREGIPQFELSVGPRGVDGIQLGDAERLTAALEAGSALTEWVRTKKEWLSDEHIADAESAAVELIRRSLDNSTGEVRLAARTVGTTYGRRTLLLEVIDNNPETTAAQDIPGTRTVVRSGVVRLAQSKGTWLEYEESIIQGLLPPGATGAEILGLHRIRVFGKGDPELACASDALQQAGFAPPNQRRQTEDAFSYYSPAPEGALVASTVQNVPANADQVMIYAAAVVGLESDYKTIAIRTTAHYQYGLPRDNQTEFVTDYYAASLNLAEWSWVRAHSDDEPADEQPGMVNLSHQGVNLVSLLETAKLSVSDTVRRYFDFARIPFRGINVRIDLNTGDFVADLATGLVSQFGLPATIRGRVAVRDGVVVAVAWIPRSGDATRATTPAESTTDPTPAEPTKAAKPAVDPPPRSEAQPTGSTAHPIPDRPTGTDTTASVGPDHPQATTSESQPPTTIARLDVREVLDQISRRLRLDGRGGAEFDAEGLSRPEIEVYQEQFAMLSGGSGEFHDQVMEQMRQAALEAPLDRYLNRYGLVTPVDEFHPPEGIMGEVDSNGVLQANIYATKRTPSGTEMFGHLMNAIGHHVRSVRGFWEVGLGERDNLDTFNALIQDLWLSPEDAALGTFTAKIVEPYGFTRVSIEGLIGHPGEYSHVRVLFTKPATETTEPESRAAATGSSVPEARVDKPPAPTHPADGPAPNQPPAPQPRQSPGRAPDHTATHNPQAPSPHADTDRFGIGAVGSIIGVRAAEGVDPGPPLARQPHLFDPVLDAFGRNPEGHAFRGRGKRKAQPEASAPGEPAHASPAERSQESEVEGGRAESPAQDHDLTGRGSPEGMAESAPEQRTRAKPIDESGLLPRELQVLELIYAGLSRSEIATRLRLSPRTVSNLSSSAARKFDTAGVIATVVEARRRGLLSNTDTSDSTFFNLSRAEMQLLRLIAEGKTNEQIAKKRKVVPYTIERHYAKIGEKLGVSGRVPIFMKALRLGLIDEDDGSNATEPTRQNSSDNAVSGGEPGVSVPSETSGIPAASDRAEYMETPALAPELSEEDVALDAEIRELERALGIETDTERTLELMLYMEDKFRDVAIIAGQDRPELLFGRKEWLSWLDARVYAKQHLEDELSVEFILELHRRLGRRMDPDNTGRFHHAKNQNWGELAWPATEYEKSALDENPLLTYVPGPLESGEYGVVLYPAVEGQPGARRIRVLDAPLTEAEIAEINENPLLGYIPAPFPTREYGVILYPNFGGLDGVHADVEAMCRSYNDAVSAGRDPFETAVDLELWSISGHHGKGDYHGRLSRILLNWTLEKAGKPPSAIPEFEEDLLSTRQDWVETVRAGSLRYRLRKAEVEQSGGMVDPVTLLGLEQARQRYEQMGGRRSPFVPGEQHDGHACRQLLATLQSEGPVADGDEQIRAVINDLASGRIAADSDDPTPAEPTKAAEPTVGPTPRSEAQPTGGTAHPIPDPDAAPAQPDPAPPTGGTTIDEPPAEMAFHHPGHNPLVDKPHRVAGLNRPNHMLDQHLGNIDNNVEGDHIPWSNPKRPRRAPTPSASQPETPTAVPASPESDETDSTTTETDADPTDTDPVELSQAVVDRIAILRARDIAMTGRMARLARAGIAFRSDPVNEAQDQILAEIARLRTTGTIIDDVPVAAGPDTGLALDWMFADRLVARARNMTLAYLISRRSATPAEAHEMLTELMRVVTRATELSLGTDHARDAADLESLTVISDWTGGGQPAPVLLDPADPADDGIPTTPTPRPLEHPSTASNSATNPKTVRQEHDSTDSARYLYGHRAVLPEDKARTVPEPVETADLGQISTLYAARMPDGRTVHFRLLGDPRGYPILVSPGTPVGIDGPLPDAHELAKRGYTLIVVERPGYGDSDPLPGRTVADCARDIIYIATELFAFDHYSVLGRSGGGSVAIAVGALDPEHVDRVVSLVGTSPVLDDRDTWMANMAEWMERMAEANQAVYRSPDLQAMVTKLTDMAEQIARDGTWLIRYNQDAFTTLDHMWVGTHRDQLARGYQRGLRNYVHAWADDSLQLVQPWGVRFDDYRVPVDIVHGSRDQFSPVSHSQTNAALIPTSTLYLFRGVTHMMGMDSLPVITHHFRTERDAFWSQNVRGNERRLSEIHRTESEPLPLPAWTYWTRGRWDAVADYDDAPVRRQTGHRLPAPPIASGRNDSEADSAARPPDRPTPEQQQHKIQGTPDGEAVPENRRLEAEVQREQSSSTTPLEIRGQDPSDRIRSRIADFAARMFPRFGQNDAASAPTWVAGQYRTTDEISHAFAEQYSLTRATCDSGTNLEAFQVFTQTFHDLYEKHSAVDVITIGITGLSDGNTGRIVPQLAFSNVRTGELLLDADFVAGLGPSQVRDAMTQLFAGAMVYAGRWRAEAHAMNALRDRFQPDGREVDEDAFHTWLRLQFPDFCFTDKGNLNVREALVRSFRDVELGSSNVTAGEQTLYKLLVDRAHELRGRAPRTSTSDEEPTSARIKKMAQDLERDFDVKVVGSDLADVDADIFEQFIGRVRVLLTDDPGLLIADPEEGRPVIRIGPFANEFMMGFTNKMTINGQTRATGFVLSERFAINAPLFHDFLAEQLEADFLVGDSARPADSIMGHEGGHAVHLRSGLYDDPDDFDNIMAELVQLFVRTTRPTDLGEFDEWLNRELSRYSRKKDGKLNLPEFYAEVYSAVTLHGKLATDAQKLAYSRIMGRRRQLATTGHNRIENYTDTAKFAIRGEQPSRRGEPADSRAESAAQADPSRGDTTELEPTTGNGQPDTVEPGQVRAPAGRTIIEGLGLPAEVATAEIIGEDPTAALLPEEQVLLDALKTNPDGVRGREIVYGRTVAHRAQARLGVPVAPVLRAGGKATGMPLWQPGLVGSISHKQGLTLTGKTGYFVAAVSRHHRAVSIDAEYNEPIPDDRRDGMALDAELAWLDRIGTDGDVHWDRVLFSAKEAVLKAWYPLTHRRLRFKDILITFDIERGEFTAQLLIADRSTLDGPPLTEFHGRFLVEGGIILTGIAVPQLDSGTTSSTPGTEAADVIGASGPIPADKPDSRSLNAMIESGQHPAPHPSPTGPTTDLESTDTTTDSGVPDYV